MTVPARNSGEDRFREVLAALTGDNFGSPAGWPRPTSDGLPISWITPCVGDKVLWAGVIEQRVVACRERWLCQVCGTALEETALAVIENGNEVVGGGALHERCLTLAQRVCPHLARSPEIVADGSVNAPRAQPSVSRAVPVSCRLCRGWVSYGRMVAGLRGHRSVLSPGMTDEFDDEQEYYRDKSPSAGRMGKAAEYLVAASCILASRGELNVATSLVDDEGVDLVFNRRDHSATLAVQVKARISDGKLVRDGTVRAQVRAQTFRA